MKWLKENDVFLRVGSLLIAVLLWAYAASNDQTDQERVYRDLPVQLEGVNILRDQDLVIMSGANSKVDIKLTGMRKDLLVVEGDPLTTLQVKTSVANIVEPGEYTLGIQAAPVGVDATVSGKDPASITVTVDRMNDIPVPVELELTGELAEGFSLAEYGTSPDYITVRGPETVLRRIQKAKVVYDISNLTSALQTNVTYTLLDEKDQPVTHQYLTADTASTMLNVELRQEGSVPVTVGFVDSPYLKSYMVKADISPASILLKGEPEDIEGINQLVLDNIDLSEVVEKKTLTFTRLLLLPDGVSLVKGQKPFANVTLTLEDCEWKTLTMDESALPEDPLFVYPEQDFSVELFGESSVLRRLRDDDVQLELRYDLEELVAGENRLPCRVILNVDEVYVAQDLEIVVLVTQEALDAALAPEPTEPQEPTEPVEPTAPQE